MPLPHGQNINEKEYREERIPGGHESFSREVKANAGSRSDNPNDITHFRYENAFYFQIIYYENRLTIRFPFSANRSKKSVSKENKCWIVN